MNPVSLSSQPSASPSNAGVVEALRLKHPERKAPLRGCDVDPASFAAVARTEVDLTGKLRRLPRHVGVGPDGVSNELLAALDRFHFD